jgi:hypothetical protein
MVREAPFVKRILTVKHRIIIPGRGGEKDVDNSNFNCNFPILLMPGVGTAKHITLTDKSFMKTVKGDNET